MADIAPVGDDALRRAALSAMSLHTAPWSDLRVPFERMDAVTCATRSPRPAEYMTWLSGFRSGEAIPQQPASTQETGITVVFFAGARIVKFRTRCCFSPTS